MKTEYKLSELNSKEVVASLIDHTLLKPEATKAEIIKICDEAKEYGFASVCVQPCYVQLVQEQLQGSQVKVCSVISFPHGANVTAVKAFEAAAAVKDGADEVDMVINVSALKNKEFELVKADIKAVVEAARPAIVKVILETCLLSEEEIKIACELAMQAGAAFVKTSTGFNKGGATATDIALMRSVVGSKLGVKASGGVRTYQDLVTMVEHGASRIGASAGLNIIKEYLDQLD